MKNEHLLYFLLFLIFPLFSVSAEKTVENDAKKLPEWMSFPIAEDAEARDRHLLSSAEQAEWEIPVSPFGGVWVKPGTELSEKKSSVSILLCWSDGSETSIGVRPTDVEHVLKTDFDGKSKGEKIFLPDAALIFTRTGKVQTYSVRPNPRCFHSANSAAPQYSELLTHWNSFTGASKHILKFELYSKSGEADVFLDGSYFETITSPGASDARVEKFMVKPGPEASAARCEDAFQLEDEAFYALDLSASPRPRAFAKDVQLVEIKEDAQKETVQTVFSAPSTVRKLGAAQIPAFLASANRAADVGVCRQAQGNWALEVDEYLRRTPSDAFPSAIHFRVPARPYFRVWVALALDDFSSEGSETLTSSKEAVLTVRLTKYIGDPGVGNSYLADTTVRLDTDFLEKHRIPNLYAERSDGQKTALYWVPVTLDVGKIIDLAAGRSWKDLPDADVKPDFLDIEFFGKPYESFHQTDERSKPDPNSTSSVQLFAATLESAPIGIDLVETRPGNVFVSGEKAEMKVKIQPYASAEPQKPVVLRCAVKDFEGKILWTRTILCEKKTSECVTIPLDFPVGFYWLDLVCAAKNDSSDIFYTTHASFSILPPDERRAGNDSPYGLWWFRFVHFVPGDDDFVGTLLSRCGARSAFYSNEPETNLSAYKIGKRQITLGPAGNFGMLTDDQTDVKPELYTALDAWMKTNLEKFPSIQEVCVFHESGPGADYPYELWGQKQVWRDGQEAHHHRYNIMLNRVGAYMKTHYPQIRLVVGNNSSSWNTIGAATRWGIDPRYIDAVGTEVTGQQSPPEKPSDMTPVSIHAAKEIARIFTGQTFPGTCCYEYTSRTERTLGYKKQAQWYVRDALAALANGFTTVVNGEIIDPGNCYHNTLWGDAGLLHRGPYCFPKPAYQAFAVLTNVMDQVRVSRRIPTGSSTVYAVEFQRFTRKIGEGTFAYAFWCARGEGKMRLKLNSDSLPCTLRFIDFFGAETKIEVAKNAGKGSESKNETGTENETENSFEIPFSGSACYVISDVPLVSASISERTFAEDDARVKNSIIVCKLDSASSLTMSDDARFDTKFDGRNVEWPVRKHAEFEMKTVQDSRMGDCVEVTLKDAPAAEGARPVDLITKYVRIEIPESLSGMFAVPKHGMGIWVRGNSNWGRLMFELEDEEGRTVCSSGVGGWGCDAYDWPGFMSVNFDGWTFIAVPTRFSEAFDAWGPGQALSNWNGPGQKSLLRDDASFRLKAIYVEMNRQTLGLTEIESVPNLSIRMKEFTTF